MSLTKTGDRIPTRDSGEAVRTASWVRAACDLVQNFRVMILREIKIFLEKFS